MDDGKIKPLQPLTEQEVIAAVRNSLIVRNRTGYSLKITGWEELCYTDWHDAVEALEEALELRPFTLDPSRDV